MKNYIKYACLFLLTLSCLNFSAIDNVTRDKDEVHPVEPISLTVL